MEFSERLMILRKQAGLSQEQLAEKCACCGKPAKKMVYWGVAY